jgi:DNA-directed RNA polymerase subunit alpha
MQPIPLPNQAKIQHLEGNTYELTLEPLYPGYGVTIGNALRRVLLSSMPGAAVTGVKIKFVDHEFASIPNVKEDVIQIILNLKQLRIRSFSLEPVRLKLKTKGEGVVTAGMIEETDQVEVVNKDMYICTLDGKNVDFEMELIVEQGRGYEPVEVRENSQNEAGMLAIDAIYTPVRSVFFDVSNVRVGGMTNFDKLVMRMETDGSITGGEAVDIASHILVDHFNMMFNNEGAQRLEMMEQAAQAEAEPTVDMPMEAAAEVVEATGTPIDDTTLSNRAKNALQKSGIVNIETLQAMTDDDIQNIAGLGDKTITEIMDLLGRTK